MNLKLLNDQINVLMIDDDLKLQKMTALYLNSQNLNFHSAFTAKEAINHQALDSINVVLIDIQLPDMTGFECAKIPRVANSSVLESPAAPSAVDSNILSVRKH